MVRAPLSSRLTIWWKSFYYWKVVIRLSKQPFFPELKAHKFRCVLGERPGEWGGDGGVSPPTLLSRRYKRCVIPGAVRAIMPSGERLITFLIPARGASLTPGVQADVNHTRSAEIVRFFPRLPASLGVVTS